MLVKAGALVDPTLPESLEKAQVFTTDLIVEGSACIGIDCASSESFGFDTLRPDHLGIMGYERDTSPGMDAIGTQSVIFERAWAPAPRTRPSFRTSTTGRWPLQRLPGLGPQVGVPRAVGHHQPPHAEEGSPHPANDSPPHGITPSAYSNARDVSKLRQTGPIPYIFVTAPPAVLEYP